MIFYLKIYNFFSWSNKPIRHFFKIQLSKKINCCLPVQSHVSINKLDADAECTKVV
jgi:hypothetical protein